MHESEKYEPAEDSFGPDSPQSLAILLLNISLFPGFSLPKDDLFYQENEPDSACVGETTGSRGDWGKQETTALQTLWLLLPEKVATAFCSSGEAGYLDFGVKLPDF